MYYIDPNNYWRDDLDDRPVMVSIHCITYNHEKFIRDALEGFVNQKTDFRFEAIVHDDASTDGAVAIIKEYAEKYPSIIKPIFETENQYSKHDDSLGKIMDAHLRGKYVAMCEGDDYWTDPLKLQKQVDFLEAHPDVSLCFHNALVHWEDGGKSDRLFADLKDKSYSGIEIYDKWTVPTASAVLKREVFFNPTYIKAINSKKFDVGDLLLWLTAVELGSAYCINETMSVYREHDGGVTKKIFINPYAWPRWNKLIPKYFGCKYKKVVENHVLIIYQNIFLCGIKKGKFKDFKALWLAFKFSPIRSLYFWWLYAKYKITKKNYSLEHINNYRGQ